MLCSATSRSAMAAKISILLLGLGALLFSAAFASDPNPLKDFCVPADGSGTVCKDVKQVQASDFSFSGLQVAGNTSNPQGFALTQATIPGLNTLGLSLVRADIAPSGFVVPHVHPRATELLVVLEGTIEAGFVTSYPENRLISKVLNKGDVFVLPKGLVHFIRNVGEVTSFGLAAFDSQNPGFIPIPSGVFGSSPKIASDLLAKAFQVDQNIIKQIQSHF